MKKKTIFLASALIFALAGKSALAEDHDHGHKAGEKEHKKDGEHQEEDHGHEEKEEGAKNVGPEKGITAFDEKSGFTLSKEALKTFSIETVKLNDSRPWIVPTAALLLTGEEKSVYRAREGAFKRIDVEVVSKNKNEAAIQSDNLKNGDPIVIKGVGHLRIAEVDATSGESGHHH